MAIMPAFVHGFSLTTSKGQLVVESLLRIDIKYHEYKDLAATLSASGHLQSQNSLIS